LEIQCSLHDILSNKPEELALGDWFTIAKQFVKTVLFLHLAGWVHKAIRSDNLLFFDKSDYSNLRLVGFEYSRQATSAQQTEGVADDLEFNLYRHPEVQGGSVPTTAKISYSPKHDIYSVGVVLLELGLKESMLNLLKTANSQPSYDHSGTAFMGFLIEQQVPKLGTVMGKTYMNVTMQCLDGSLLNEQERSLQESVYLKVFRPLEQYQVL
jgi:serine/threonine protein kinase